MFFSKANNREDMDRLVRLYDVPPPADCVDRLARSGVIVRTARAYEKSRVVAWVGDRFGQAWADECAVAFSNHPVSCFIATQQGTIIGFACYESTCKNFFGPIGVGAAVRRRGIGRALLLSCLHAMAVGGYAYAVIGGGDHAHQFYAATVDAMEIKGSSPGIYRDRLKNREGG